MGVIAGGTDALTRAIEGAEDRPELAEHDLDVIGLNSADVLVGIATSGRTPYVLGALAHARKRKTFTVALACNVDSELAAAADLAITPLVGPEVLSGSTRLKAGTATKLVLNMLSTGAMVQLGKTFGDLMVDMRATNSKLRARANRIVRHLTGLSVEEAGTVLERCGGELKTALLVQLARITPEEARTRLQAAHGRIRDALIDRGSTSGPDLHRPHVGASLLLGLDGGGSHTTALLAQVAAGDGNSAWTILGRGEAGPSNLQAVGADNALRALEDAVTRAFAAAGRERCTVASAAFGLAGGDRSADQALIQEWARRVHLAGQVQVSNDAAPLLAAGTPHGWGVALIAGTGSIAYGRSAAGVTARAGGWGYLLGDEGSGYALAMAGLQAVARAADGRGSATALTEELLQHLGLGQPQELIPAVYRGGLDRTALAAFAPLILGAADKGDPVALQLVEQAAHELASLVAAVARTLGMASQPLPLAIAGGVILHSLSYQQAVLQGLADLGLRAEPVTPVPEPATGSLRIAQAHCRLPPGQAAVVTSGRP